MMADHGDWMFFSGYMWLLWIPLIVVIFYVLKLLTGGETKYDDSPISILRKRYAKGEIDKEEFERRKQELRKN